MKLNVLLVGEDAAGIQMLRAIRESEHHLVAVLTSPNSSSILSAPLWKIAQNSGDDTWPAEWVRDPELAQRIRQEQVDILLNVYSLYKIHPKNLDAPRIGSFNLHPGPLPRYAGLNSVSWAIYRGETTHGITIHKMTANIDAGPVVYQTLFGIEGDSALVVGTKCVGTGVKRMIELLETAACDPKNIPSIQQDLTLREYFGNEVPQNGWVDWTRTARQVYDFIRACDFFPLPSPWDHPKTTLHGQQLKIVKANLTNQSTLAAPGTVGEVDAAGAQVACSDQWLTLREVMREGKVLKAQEVLKNKDQLESLVAQENFFQ